MANAEFLNIMAPEPFMWYNDGQGLFNANVAIGKIIEPGTVIGSIISEPNKSEVVTYVGTRRARVVELATDCEEADVSKPLARLKLLGPSRVTHTVTTRRRGNPAWNIGKSAMIADRRRIDVGDVIRTNQTIGRLIGFDPEGEEIFPERPIRYYGPKAKVVWLIQPRYREVESGTIIMLVQPIEK